MPATVNARSKKRRWIWLLLCALLFAGITAAGSHLLDRFLHKRFAVVREGVMYRMGQPTQRGLENIIRDHRIRSVLVVRVDDARLRGGALDLGARSGGLESEIVARTGAQLHHVPFPNTVYWPWPAPDHLEDLLDFVNNPDNQPILVHCVGGKHRTGTVVALFRMDVDRWSPADAIKEMQAFDFGEISPVQDLNLRTFWARPRPSPKEWLALSQELCRSKGPSAPFAQDESARYDLLLRQWTSPPATGHGPTLDEFRALVEYVLRDRPFALPLAQRVLRARSRLTGFPNRSDMALQSVACQRATSILAKFVNDHTPATSPTTSTTGTPPPAPVPPEFAPPETAPPEILSSAAALLADFGDSVQQQTLRAAIKQMSCAAPQSSYAIALGISNRYASNRLPLLRVLLEDKRPLPLAHHAVHDYDVAPDARRPPPGEIVCRYRYCDIATARLMTIEKDRKSVV